MLLVLPNHAYNFILLVIICENNTKIFVWSNTPYNYQVTANFCSHHIRTLFLQCILLYPISDTLHPISEVYTIFIFDHYHQIAGKMPKYIENTFSSPTDIPIFWQICFHLPKAVFKDWKMSEQLHIFAASFWLLKSLDSHMSIFVWVVIFIIVLEQILYTVFTQIPSLFCFFESGYKNNCVGFTWIICLMIHLKSVYCKAISSS